MFFYLVLQLQPGQQGVGFFVLVDGLVDDILRKLVVTVGIGLEPVADKLLVKGGLAVAGLVSICGPEAAAVRGEHLVAENDIALLVQTELEFGVGYDNAAALGIFSAFFVKGDRAVPDLFSIFLSLAGELFFQNLNAPLLRSKLMFSSWSPISALVLGV